MLLNTQQPDDVDVGGVLLSLLCPVSSIALQLD